MPDTSGRGWTPELLAARRRRAIVMALALGVLVAMFFAVTWVRLADNAAQSTHMERVR